MASSAQQKQFINDIGYIIQEEAKKRGYKVASAIIAQACIESGYNTSLLSMKYHNYFGMKCGSAWKGPSVNLATKEEYNSQLVSIRDNFRVYGSMEEGVKGYFDFISTNRYSNLKTAETAEEYLKRIKADGYATSSTYVSTCMSVVNRHDLTSYDTVKVYKPITPELILSIINGEYGNGAAREAKLVLEGYKYDDVRKKINDLDKIAREYLPNIRSKGGEYWKCVISLMLL